MTEEDVAALVADVRAGRSPQAELLPLLREDSPAYDGRGSAGAGRIRAWVMAAFGDVGCPPAAEPVVLAELEREQDAQLLAAAARAVRGMADPGDEVAAALVTALRRLPAGDRPVSFDGIRPDWPAADATTVVAELVGALAWLGPRAAPVRSDLEALRVTHGPTWGADVRRALDDVVAALPVHEGACCGHPAAPARPAAAAPGTRIADALLEDQDGARTTFGAAFRGRPSALAFFYTRCENPEKCSLTITRLAELQAALEEAGLRERANVAALTYDPAHDLPHRLRRYGEARGLRFGPRARMFRAEHDHEAIRRHFALRVGYAGSLVNRHAVELFVLGPDAEPALAWSGRPWDTRDVVAALAARAADATPRP
ncbi:MAG: SCO family protein [Thermoleophilia bacterium]